MKDENYGVKYEYLLPVSSSPETDNNSTKLARNMYHKSIEKNNIGMIVPEHKYYWKVTGFSACSKSCGGGLQVPHIKCVRDNSNRYFPQRRCSNLKKPLLNDNLLRCNTQPCPAYWRSEEWGRCNCKNFKGTSEREVRCVQELSSGIVIQVNKSNCFDEAPESSQPCHCQSMSNVKRKRKKNQSTRKSNSTGTWLYSPWNGRCSSACGSGYEHRSIFCEKSDVLNGVCDTSFSPEVSKVCNNGNVCDKADWFTGPWSECSGSCFNLTKTREVLCIQNNLITDLDDCDISEKPSSSTNCSLNDVDYCKPNWHYSDWSEVSKLESS